MEIVKQPHLPTGKVKAVICGSNSIISKLLNKRGVEVVNLNDDIRLPTAVRSHADIQCCHIGNGVILTTNPNIIPINGYEIQLIAEIPGNTYPNDCLLNCFVIRNILISGKSCSRSVIEYAQQGSIEIRMVNQGYAKCSTVIVSDDAIITADKTIAKALENDCKVLMIKPGSIRLDGYNYGFIGGACGKLSANELAFYGNPYRHTDGKRIISFIEDNNCEAISLCNGELVDFGGFIPIKG